MGYYEEKASKILQKMTQTMVRLDQELDEIDRQSKDNEKSLLAQQRAERRALHDIKRILHDVNRYDRYQEDEEKEIAAQNMRFS